MSQFWREFFGGVPELFLEIFFPSGIAFVVLLIINHLTGWLDKLCEYLFGSPVDEEELTEKNRREGRKHRVRQWRVALPFLTWRHNRRIKKAEREAKHVTTSSIAETLATHQEVLDAMYGKAPGVAKITKEVLGKREF